MKTLCKQNILIKTETDKNLCVQGFFTCSWSDATWTKAF